MERDQIRLDCLRLAVSTSSNLGEQLLRAETFFEFVSKPEKPGEGDKSADNTRPLSAGGDRGKRTAAGPA